MLNAPRLLAHVLTSIDAERPDLALRHGRDTALSKALRAMAATLMAAHPDATAVKASLAVLGVSQSGELHTLDALTRSFDTRGKSGIDPVVFAKANQFFPVFAVGRELGCTGPASTLFTSEPRAADLLHHAWLLLRSGHARYVLALGYEQDRDAAGDESAPVRLDLAAFLFGPAGSGPSLGPILERCSLGPYLGRGAGREATLRSWRRRRAAACPPAGEVELTTTDLGDVVRAFDLDDVDRRTVHLVPRGVGNILSVSWCAARAMGDGACATPSS